jgi:Peptidase family M28
VIDFRLYRAAFLPALLAVVILLFAVQTPPAPLPTVVAPAEFDEVGAAKIARQIVDRAPARAPGSAGDAAIADMVETRFRAVRDGQVAEQDFTGSVDGKDVQLRNLILTLPGASPRCVVVLASRDSASGPGAASSAAATAALVELVSELENSRHAKTLVFVSTDGASDGALGAREFAAHFPQRDLIDGAIVLWQPGSTTRREPSLLDTSDGPESASSGLVRTTQRALADQAGARPPGIGLFGELARLALPSGLGDQAVLIQRGIAAVGLSSAGARPLPVAQDQPEDLSTSTLGDFGRTALLLAVTLDASPAPEHGPAAYVTLSGSLVPGWSLALLALALLLPALVASMDGLRRARRGADRIGWGLWWSASRALPLIGALLLLYLLAAIGIVARPAFPFDPNRYGIGAGEIVVMALLAAVVGIGYRGMRGWRVPAGLGTEVAAPSLGLVSGLAVLLAWTVNPFLALIVVPAAHVWLLDARRGNSILWPVVLVAALASMVPLGAAVGDLVGRLELGSAAPWQLLLMIGGGQIGFGSMLALCLLVGCLAGIVALAARRTSGAPRRRPAPGAVVVSRVEAQPATRVDDDLDASPIAPSGMADDLGDER